ncbi:PHB depolymerase family esterase [Stakelama sediminis]|nr:PHB depolymerase family esterase [Stakelama sediminis]
MHKLLIALCALVLTSVTAPFALAQSCRLGTPGQSVEVAIADTGRPMLMHRPALSDEARTPLPLVVLLHGSGSTGKAMLAESGLARTADAHGFIVAAPDAGIPAGKGFVWNIPGVPTITGKVPGPKDADDVAYLRNVISDLVAKGCVDPTRVYVTGMSGGGRMTSWLGCVLADRIAAIAPVVGLRAGNPWKKDPARPDPASCTPSKPMPVIAFAGDKDTVNPITGGGAGYWHYSMHAAEQRWAQLNHCTHPPTTRWVSATTYEERYTGCRDDSDVVGRIMIGKGHGWDADNDAMWAFLSRYRRAS